MLKRSRLIHLALVVGLIALSSVVVFFSTDVELVLGVGSFSVIAGLSLLLALAILVVIHESAHLVAARVLGWHVRRVVIGTGRVLWQFHLAAPIEIRTIPFSGAVFVEPKTARWARLSYTLISLAGPASELFLAALLACSWSFDQPFLRIVASIFVPLILLHSMLSLVPHSFMSEPYGRIPSDGLNIVRALVWGHVPKALSDVAAKSNYPLDAFEFVRRTLSVATTRPASNCLSRHVTGAELCKALRDSAIESFGPRARAILESWRIRSCADFGEIVFAMVEGRLVQASEHDSIEDFSNVFDFDAGFKEVGAAQSVEALV